MEWLKHLVKFTTKKNSKYDLSKIVRRNKKWYATNGYAAFIVESDEFDESDLILDKKLNETSMAKKFPVIESLLPHDEPVTEVDISAKNIANLLAALNKILQSKRGEEVGIKMKIYKGDRRPIVFERELGSKKVTAIHMQMKNMSSSSDKTRKQNSKGLFERFAGKRTRKVIVKSGT